MITQGKPARFRRGRAVAIATVAVIGAGGFGSPVTQAAWPDTSAFHNAREISDAELNGMRGRFVSNGTIMFFGVQMISEWRTSAGEILTAQADLSARIAGSTPTVRFEPSVSAISLADYQQSQSEPNNSITIANNASSNVRGVMQTIQVGGDGNAINNRLEIDVYTGQRQQPVAGGNNENSITTIHGSQLNVTNMPGHIGLSINVPNQGRISQDILAKQGLRQSAQIQGSLQQIQNVTRLQIQIQQRSNMNSGQVRQALQSIRGLQNVGG